MSAIAKPKIFRSAITGWSDAFRAIGSMKALFAVAFLILVALDALSSYLLGNIYLRAGNAANAPWTTQLADLAFGLLRSFFVTPVAIAVHRFILLGEVTDRYTLNPADPRFQRFFGFTVLLGLIASAPATLMNANIPGIASTLAVVIKMVAFIVLLIGCFIAVRSVILFPTIAIDAPDGGWGNALRRTRGRFWRVFFILLVSVLPVMILGGALFGVSMMAKSNTSAVSTAIIVGVGALLSVPTVAALAVVASRLYTAFTSTPAPPAADPVTGAAPVAPRRRRYGWWIAGAITAALIGLGYYYVYVPASKYMPIIWAYMNGLPQFEGCTTTVKTEAKLQSAEYRITEHKCSWGVMNVVFLKQQNAPFWRELMTNSNTPAFDTVPREVRQRDDKTFEIVLSKAVAGEGDRLVVTLNDRGDPNPLYRIKNGRRDQ